MEIASLGYRTDLMVLRLGGSEIVRHPCRIVVRTPANPTYWWGNFTLFRDPVDGETLDERLERFTRDHPGAEHVAWGIDTMDGTLGDEAALRGAGFEVSRDTVLAASSLRPSHPVDGAELRRLDGDADWERSVELRTACFADDGLRAGEAFIRAHVAAARALCERGHAMWFGAFEGDRLYSAVGVVSDGTGVARFQMVETHPSARRRGLATALVHRAGSAALEAGARTLVILADPGYHAIDIYRRLGFDDRETKVELERRPRRDDERRA